MEPGALPGASETAAARGRVSMLCMPQYGCLVVVMACFEILDTLGVLSLPLGYIQARGHCMLWAVGGTALHIPYLLAPIL
jgi:hypothetical protein